MGSKIVDLNPLALDAKDKTLFYQDRVVLMCKARVKLKLNGRNAVFFIIPFRLFVLFVVHRYFPIPLVN